MITHRLISCLGLFAMIGIAWLFSSHRRQVKWRLVLGGLALQLLLALLILWTPYGRIAFQSISDSISHLDVYVEKGSGFVFHIYPREMDEEKGRFPPHFALLRTFAFGVLPTVIFFSSLMSVFYRLGIMQQVVKQMAWLMQWVLGTSGSESLAATANVFVGHTEAPLVVKPYIKGMTMSELNAMMVGGFATVTGGLLLAYQNFGVEMQHLLIASIISAPAALLIAKVLVPETEKSETYGSIKIHEEQRAVNVMEAAAIGASDGMKLAINIAAMLIAFLALLALIDGGLAWVGSWVGLDGSDGRPQLNLALILGYLFAPLAWLMGIEAADCIHAGQLLGTKMVANEFVAYMQLGEWLKADSAVQLSPRTIVILTYALSGFSNFCAIGIQIGGIGGMVPERRSDLARLGLRAMLGGTLACCMTGCVAGILT
jgi:CNT family concentrative nucleoside transporter